MRSVVIALARPVSCSYKALEKQTAAQQRTQVLVAARLTSLLACLV